MDERLFGRLAALLVQGPAVLASVLHTRGATPRKSGSRMLITAEGSEFSIGGGEAEARVLVAARQMLEAGQRHAELCIDLSGGAGAAGICGGQMLIALRLWQDEQGRQVAGRLAETLASGHTATLPANLIGAGAEDALLRPDLRLIIVGAGHCGLALFQLARYLDFDIWVHDQRESCFAGDVYAGARQLCGEAGLLQGALDTPRSVFVVLLTRNFQCDLDALTVLSRQPPAFVGMMGSQRRVRQVLAAAPPAAAALPLAAPVGIHLAAETPHEIALSILAQLVERRAAQEHRC